MNILGDEIANFANIENSSVLNYLRTQTSQGNPVNNWSTILPIQNVNMIGYKLTNLSNPSTSGDSVNLSYLKANYSTGFLPLTGGVLSGTLSMFGNGITNVGSPSASGDVVNLGYLQANYTTASSGIALFYDVTQDNVAVPVNTPFNIPTQYYNSIPSLISATTAGTGSAFSLATGTYIIDYEMSLEGSGSVALYTGSSIGGLTIDTSTVAGSTTPTTWIHGRAVELVNSSPYFIAVCSVVGAATVVPAGTDNSSYMIRLTIQKIA